MSCIKGHLPSKAIFHQKSSFIKLSLCAQFQTSTLIPSGRILCGLLFLLLFLWHGENKVNSYSNQLKLCWVCKLKWSLTKAILPKMLIEVNFGRKVLSSAWHLLNIYASLMLWALEKINRRPKNFLCLLNVVRIHWNTSLAAPGALANRLQRRTACNT